MVRQSARRVWLVPILSILRVPCYIRISLLSARSFDISLRDIRPEVHRPRLAIFLEDSDLLLALASGVLYMK